jgi:tRNA modification GTPase
MSKSNLNDTITAISTSLGESGIGIVRLSGKCALSVADKVFLPNRQKPRLQAEDGNMVGMSPRKKRIRGTLGFSTRGSISKDKLKPSQFKTYTVHYGHIVDTQSAGGKAQDAKIIDEVILTIMRAPRSYTKEDVVEINCHGGIVAARAVLDLALRNGCRLAEPGEFTKRAFLNGRIDLAQAEAVLDIIRAKTDAALKIGTEQLKGTLSCQINNLRKRLLDILATLEANIDFPDEEIGAVNLSKTQDKLSAINEELINILDTSKRGRIMREGIHVVICGKPNVGKSSLLNALLKQERSIVTPVPGTTRDTIEEIIDIGGIPIRIVDTAGILEPRDLVEKKAIQRSKHQIDLADLIILLFDGSRRLSKEDFILIKKIKAKHAIAIINKIDLKQKIERDKILAKFPRPIDISAKKLRNIELLEEAIIRLVHGDKIVSPESAIVANLRHAQLLSQAQKLIAEALNSLDNKLSLEFMAEGIKVALGHFDDLLGKRFSQDLLDKIFSEFCIGK